jgi:hypothetical protein
MGNTRGVVDENSGERYGKGDEKWVRAQRWLRWGVLLQANN